MSKKRYPDVVSALKKIARADVPIYFEKDGKTAFISQFGTLYISIEMHPEDIGEYLGIFKNKKN